MLFTTVNCDCFIFLGIDLYLLLKRLTPRSLVLLLRNLHEMIHPSDKKLNEIIFM